MAFKIPPVPLMSKETDSEFRTPITPNAVAIAQEIVTVINKIRVDNGLKPLIQDKRLNESALKKTQDMVDRKYWSHADPDGKMAWDMIKGKGYDYKKAGENLAKKYNDQRSIEEWMKSPSHKKNILNPDYTDIGVGRSGDFNVTHFGKE